MYPQCPLRPFLSSLRPALWLVIVGWFRLVSDGTFLSGSTNFFVVDWTRISSLLTRTCLFLVVLVLDILYSWMVALSDKDCLLLELVI
jgi:hypothetical protein